MPQTTTSGRDGAARVLVVDDSPVIRRAIEKKLQNEFDLVMATDGEAGWDALTADDRVRVLVTDIEMPKLDGYSFICRIRASEDRRLREIPIIAITAAEDEETKERALACGATDFVVKPIDAIQLLARVHALAKLNVANRRLVETEAALKDQATLDPLTQLYSRRYFQQSCQQDLAYAVRHGQGLALIRMEIDGFKTIYRQHGDDRVDRMLVWLAGQFTSTCRREDTVSRIGGAEFAVAAPATNLQKAQALCRRLCNAVAARPFVIDGTDIPVTLSIGVVTLDEGVARDYDDLMRTVEHRTRRARIAGGNRVLGPEAVAPEPVDDVPLIADAPALAGAVGGSEILVLPDMAGVSTLEFDTWTATGNDPAGQANEHNPALDLPADQDPALGLDDALRMLANGETDHVEPWLDNVVRRVLPLLEFYNDRRDGALTALIADIKMRCLGRQ